MIPFLITIFGGLTNTLVRGGLLKNWFPRLRDTKVIYAGLYALTALFVVWWPDHALNWKEGVFSILMGAAMWIGSVPAIFEPNSDHALADRAVGEWTWIVLKRGLIWTFPIMLVMKIFYGLAASACIPAALLMPLAYSWCWWFEGNHIVNDWTLSEFSYGLLLWLPVAMLMYC